MSDETQNGTATAGSTHLGRVRRRGIADERAVRAVHLRTVESNTWQQIGNELGVTAGAAQAAYNRGVLLLVPKDDIDFYRGLALQKLDIWEQEVLEIFRKDHPLVNFGKVVFGEFDESVKLAAMDRLIKIERERRAIMGYSAPSKRVLEVISEDAFDRAIRELNVQAEQLEHDTEVQDQLKEALGPAPSA